MATLELLDDGVFVLKHGDRKLKGRIRAVATAADVVMVSSLGDSFIAADVFLPEAVEEAKKRNVTIMNIEDLIKPISDLMISLLVNRRGDLLVKLFDSIIPQSLARGFSYNEGTSYKGDKIIYLSFTVEIKIPERYVNEFLEDLSTFLSKLSTKLSEVKDLDVEFKSSKGYEGHTLTLSISKSM